MTFDDFVRESTPMVCEIVCECLKMNDEEYQEYKAEMETEMDKLGKPWIMEFWRDVFSLITSYRKEEAIA